VGIGEAIVDAKPPQYPPHGALTARGVHRGLAA
jgi:hypothetical protein